MGWMIQLECPWLYTSQQKQYILTGKWLQVTYCTTVVHCYQMKFLKCRGITLYLLFVIPCAMKRSSHLGLYSILSRDIPFSLNCGQLGLAIQGTEKTWLILYKPVGGMEAASHNYTELPVLYCCTPTFTVTLWSWLWYYLHTNFKSSITYSGHKGHLPSVYETRKCK